MNKSPETADLTRFDVRSIPCRVKHAQIFQRWSELRVGDHFVLVNDHDPVPLYYQFSAQFPGAFAWDYLPAGADEFQVKITRLAVTSANPPPPGRAAPAPLGIEIDARGLEPPEPLLRILTAAEALAKGATLRARTDRQPLHLYPELATRGICATSEEQSDGSWLTLLRRS
jgi:uncharacterized protein (DUF2249 family)